MRAGLGSCPGPKAPADAGKQKDKPCFKFIDGKCALAGKDCRFSHSDEICKPHKDKIKAKKEKEKEGEKGPKKQAPAADLEKMSKKEMKKTK